MTQLITELLNFLFIISNSQLSGKYLFFGKLKDYPLYEEGLMSLDK